MTARRSSKRVADPRAGWKPDDAQLVKNSRENETIARLEATLDGLYAARRGRVINGSGWCYCYACGKGTTVVNLDVAEEAQLVDGRATGVCCDCTPDDRSVEALDAFIAPAPEVGPIVGPFEDFARAWTRRPTPELVVRRYARGQLDRARRNARETIDRLAAGQWWDVSRGDLAILRVVGDEADVELGARALAAVTPDEATFAAHAEWSALPSPERGHFEAFAFARGGKPLSPWRVEVAARALAPRAAA